MELKIKRQAYLNELLSGSSFRRQEEVVKAMLQKGFEVTQSSISRDFREIGVIKVGGVYRPGKTIHSNSQSPLQAMIKGIDTAGPHLIVVQTTPGAAAAVAEAIDLEEIDGIAGTVAGDNTIIIATKSSSAQVKAVTRIQNI